MLRLTFGVPITKYVLIIILMVWSFFSRCCPLHFECKVREDGIHYWCQQIRHTDRDYGLCVWSVKTQVFADKWFDSAICLGQMSSSCPLMEKRFITAERRVYTIDKAAIICTLQVLLSNKCFFDNCQCWPFLYLLFWNDSVDHSFLFDYSWSWLS